MSHNLLMAFMNKFKRKEPVGVNYNSSNIFVVNTVFLKGCLQLYATYLRIM